MARSPFWLAVVLLCCVVPARSPGQSAHVALTRRLAQWKDEIERKSGGKVVLVRIYTDPLRNEMRLPEDAEQRSTVRRYLMEESFRGQLATAHALTINYTGTEGKFHFVLLNMASEDQWSGMEEALIADEFGHLWLSASGYEALPYYGGERACIAIHAADAVQHILVREEVLRRGIPYREYWLRNLDAALRNMESEAAGAAGPAPPCQALARLALWLDVRIGLSPQLWKNFSRFQEIMARNARELAPYADELEKQLRELDADRSGPLPPLEDYRKALGFALKKFGEVYDKSR